MSTARFLKLLFIVASAALVFTSLSFVGCSGDDDDDDAYVDCSQFSSEDECTANSDCKWESMVVDLSRLYPTRSTEDEYPDDTTGELIGIDDNDTTGGSCTNINPVVGSTADFNCEDYLAEFDCANDAIPGYELDADGNCTYTGETIDYEGYVISFSFDEFVKGARVNVYKTPVCGMSDPASGKIILQGVPVDENGFIHLVSNKKNFVPSYDMNKMPIDNEVNIINSTLANMLPNLVFESFNQDTAVIAGSVYDSVDTENGIADCEVTISPSGGNRYYTEDGTPSADQQLTEPDSSIFIFFAVPPAEGTSPDFAYTLTATKSGQPIGAPVTVDTFGGSITITNIYQNLGTE